VYKIYYTKKALADIARIKGAKLDKKARALIAVVAENPYANPPAYEKLKGDLDGLYSRRINIQHRLVYEVDEKRKAVKLLSMKLVSCYGHARF
jgi:Txe/YoeB family toxin of toxin-antitoxin system